jgi:hypothetical protein
LHGKSGRAEEPIGRHPHRAVIVDYEDERHPFRHGISVAVAVGTVNAKVVPGPALGSAHNRPPCASTIERLMARPMPIPSGLVV